MATSFFYIYMIDIYIDIYKLTEHPVVLLNAIFVAELSIFITMSDDKTKSQQRIRIYFWGCSKFHLMPNWLLSNLLLLNLLLPNLLLPNLLFVDNVGILCYVSPICQSLRSAPREANMPDSTNNLGSNVVQVLQVRHQIPHLLRYVKNII